MTKTALMFVCMLVAILPPAATAEIESHARAGITPYFAEHGVWDRAAAGAREHAAAAAVRLLSSLITPGTVNAGQTVQIAATLVSSVAQNDLVVELQLHDPLGNVVAEWSASAQDFQAHVPKAFTWNFVVPSTATPSNYFLTASAGPTGASEPYLAVDTHTSFSIVGAGVCTTPAASRFDFESAAQNFGFSIHGPSDYAAIAATGAGVVRTNLYWSVVETTPGVYDFSSYDAIVDGLLANNLKPLLILGYGNGLYTGGSAGVAQWKAAFANYARAAAAHYHGLGVIWEIWNEPDGATFWNPPDAADYATLVMAAAPAIRAADDSAPILAGVTSGVDWVFVQAIAAAGVLPYVDAISVHPYRHNEPESVTSDLATLRAIMESAAPPCARQLPIVSSEWGYSTTWDTGTLAPYASLQQAYFLAREWLMGSYLGLPAAIYYDFQDDGTDPTNIEDNFGAMNADGSAKAAYAAASNLGTQLQGFSYSHRIPTGNPDDWQLLFLSGDEVAVVAWTDDFSVGIGDSANVPQVVVLNPASAGYAQTFRSAEITYPHHLLMAAPGNDVLANFVVQNHESTTADIVLQVGTSSAHFTLAPGERYTATQELSVGSNMNVMATSFPVTVSWNGAAVTGLPVVQVANFAAIAALPGFPLGNNCGTMACYDFSQ